jgi:cell wall-associated NlpC family hydrolase
MSNALPKPTHHPVHAELEAAQRKRVVQAALSWVGTPYRQLGYVKGAKGCVDCSMLLVGAFVEAGVYEAFDPRPYSANWMLSQSEEKYLRWLDSLAMRTDRALRPGDVVAYRFGRCFSHSGIVVDDKRIVHAYASARMCTLSDLDFLPLSRRPQINYDMWGRLRGPK